MAAPFVRDQWSLGILVGVSIEYLALPSTQAQPALEAGADRQPRRLRGAGLGVCSAPLVLPGAAWRPGACFCAAPILQRNYGVAPPMRDWADDADSSVLALRPLAPWKAWKAWFQDVNRAWHLPQPPFPASTSRNCLSQQERRWTRARLAHATRHGGLESQHARGFIFAN